MNRIVAVPSGMLIVLFILCGLMCNIECEDFRRDFSKEKLAKAKQYLKDLSNHKRGWIDPADLIFNSNYEEANSQDLETMPSSQLGVKETQLLESSPSTQSENADAHLDTVSAEDFKSSSSVNLDAFFITRWCNRFLKFFYTFIDSEEPWRKTVSFTVTNTQVARINDLMQQSAQNLVDLEEVVVDILSSMKVSDEEGYLSGLPSLLPQNDKSVFMSVIFIVLLILVYIFHLCPHPKTCILIVVIVITVGCQWKVLYEEALAKKAAKLDELNDSACRKGDLGLFESMQYYFKSFLVSSDSCTEYYKAKIVDPLWEVSLMEAISLAFSKCLFAPLKSLAQALNKAVKLLVVDLSITEMIILVSFIFLVLIMGFNYKIQWPWFFASIEPGPSGNSSALPAALVKLAKNQVLGSVNDNTDCVSKCCMDKQLVTINFLNSGDNKDSCICHTLKSDGSELSIKNEISKSITTSLSNENKMVVTLTNSDMKTKEIVLESSLEKKVGDEKPDISRSVNAEDKQACDSKSEMALESMIESKSNCSENEKYVLINKDTDCPETSQFSECGDSK